MFAPVEKQRVATKIVEQLRERILSGDWKPGEMLPSERELSRIFGVTRVSLREALRILEQESLIETRHGEGSRVKDFVSHAGLDILQHLLKIDASHTELLRSILEFRVMVGTEITRLAAQRATAQDLDALEAIVREEAEAADDAERLMRTDFAFFERIAAAARNIVVRFILNSVREIYLSQPGLFAPLIGDPHMVVKRHREIVAALRKRDGVRAARLARDYFTRGMQSFFAENGDGL